MHEPARLLADRLDHVRVAVPELHDRDAGEEVEVLVALGVPEARALAAHELDRVARVGRHRGVALELLESRRLSGHTFVPMPASVNSSSSSECGSRPSTMCAAPTPARRASPQASSFGSMPPLTVGQALAHLRRGGLGDAAAGIGGVGEPALDVGQEDHLVGAERRRHRPGRLVGVHVVRAALGVGADRGDHRDVVLGDVVQHVDVDALDLAHEAEVASAVAPAAAACAPGTASRRRRRARPPAARGG